MGIILGDNPGTIKSWSFNMVIPADMGIELCVDCADEQGLADDESSTPIFADSEIDRNPVCDQCGYTSFCFSPTAECVNDWVEMLYDWCLTRHGNTEFLDRVQREIFFVSDDEVDNATAELYRVTRSITTMFGG